MRVTVMGLRVLGGAEINKGWQMKVLSLSKILFVFCVLSCSKSTEPDYSGITNPAARWQAYGMNNYSIDQSRNCFCVHGGVTVRVFIRDNQIVNVFDISKGTSLPQNQWQWYKTVDQLFTIISGINKDSVASFRVDYDSKYGYPTNFFVDPNAQIADEEYGYDSKNLNSF